MAKRLWICLSVLAMMLLPARAEIIVVAVSGTDEIAPGTRLASGQSISLPEGARLTLLSQAGEMQVLEGPYSGEPTAKNGTSTQNTDAASWSAVLALVGDPDARSDVMGASRVTDGAFMVPPSIWHISVDSSGPRCTLPDTVALWRRDAGQGTDVSIRSSAGRLTDVVWPAKEHMFSLPNEFAADGRLMVSIDSELRELTLIVAPEDLRQAGPGAVFTWLMEHKCQRQALALIERVHAGLSLTD
ncbi:MULTISPECIES: hypothetical protein [unclassified Roseibium]|uniref:hypothetical protein n=1 Tax=unclassified Roseibium TaxID=2629323 RepID=UPI00273FA2F8|nr:MULTISPECIES: hypothetical protein [unclassified Roseibium]